ncbi:MAG: adenylate/guanylate cyclase domain-containing protein [Pseudomonadales bacterium]|nr:adenylate/guanylate cyclase domain-containing protein [Pseudomonadales bacterium]
MQLLSRFFAQAQTANPVFFILNLRPWQGRVLVIALAMLTTWLLLAFFDESANTLEERIGAQGWVLSAQQRQEERISIVAIDEKSLAAVGPWPWSRSDMARLTQALNAANVQLQVHDIVYPESRAGDDLFLAALSSSRGAVLAQVPVLDGLGSDQQVRTGTMTHAVTGLACNDTASVNATGFIANSANYASIPKGHITPLVASDGAIRKIPAFVCIDGKPYPALAISALLQATGSTDNWAVSIVESSGWFQPERVLRLNSYPGLGIPLDEANNLRVSYQDLPESFRAFSAIDVMEGTIDPDLLDNAWVLVGAVAFGMGDIVPTPYKGAAPGVELQARLLSSLLDSAVPYTPVASEWLLAGLSIIFALLLLLIAGRERLSAYGLPMLAILLPALAISLHISLLQTRDIWLGWLFPAFSSLAAAFMLLLLEQGRVRVERARVFGNLSSYLPTDIAREIAYSLPSSSINARRCEVTLLNADLRNFSAFGELRPPEESAALLHFFFVKATEIIESHKGRIHEFKGDGLMAVWDGQNTAAAEQALSAAREMQQSIQKDMPQHPPSGLEPLALGIGIEQGPALIGSIGPAHRRSHTLLGDTVTITLRIQEMTAELAQPILLGECIARQLQGAELESQGSYLLNGLRTPHTLFALSPPEQSSRSRVEQLNLKIVSGGKLN